MANEPTDRPALSRESGEKEHISAGRNNAGYIPIEGIKLAVLDGVREYCERYPVELWLTHEGRVVVRATNEGGNNTTDVDLWDILDWLSVGPRDGILLANGSRAASD